MTKKEIFLIIKPTLEKLYFVNWDRYVDMWARQGILDFYGWIDREKDSYKDFVFLEFNMHKYGGLPWYITSSVLREDEIDDILGYERIPDQNCKRVEELFSDLENAIKLK